MWVDVKINLKELKDEGCRDAISSYLFDLGAEGVVEKKSGLEAPFKAGRVDSGLISSLKAYLNALKPEFPFKYRVEFKKIKESNWNEKWKRHFKPSRISRRFVVKPAWESYKAKNKEIIIIINPGMAFGTGLHPTTRMIIKAMEAVIGKGLKPEESSFLDVGTGTGILAIAAKKLGYADVSAIDIDTDALKVAKENIENNSLSGKINLSSIDIAGIKESFSVVAANITAKEIIGIWDSLYSKVKKDGFLLISGILERQEREFLNHALCSSLLLEKRLKQKEWTAFIFKKIL